MIDSKIYDLGKKFNSGVDRVTGRTKFIKMIISGR